MDVVSNDTSVLVNYDVLILKNDVKSLITSIFPNFRWIIQGFFTETFYRTRGITGESVTLRIFIHYYPYLSVWERLWFFMIFIKGSPLSEKIVKHIFKITRIAKDFKPYSRWAFSGLLTDGGDLFAPSPSLQFFTHILQWWNLAQIYRT